MAGGHDELSPDRPDQKRTARLDVGGTYRMQYELWGHPGSAYLPPGTYEFSRKCTVDSETAVLTFKAGITPN
jgi:hypothetical protein